MVAARLLMLLALPSPAAAGALFGRETQQRRLQRENQGAEAACGVFSGAAAWWGGGQLYTKWTPPGMAYRALRKPLLSQNQRVALVLAAAAAGTSAARVALEGDGPATEALQKLGRATADGMDRVANFFASFGDRARRAREERERAARQEWLRANAKPARVMVSQ